MSESHGKPWLGSSTPCDAEPFSALVTKENTTNVSTKPINSKKKKKKHTLLQQRTLIKIIAHDNNDDDDDDDDDESLSTALANGKLI